VVLRQARHDGRKRYVELTAKGRSLLPRAWRLWRRAENRFEEIFGKDPAAETASRALEYRQQPRLGFTTAALRFSIDTVRCGAYIFNLGYMPLIANECTQPPASHQNSQERNNLACIALRIETSGPVLLGS